MAGIAHWHARLRNFQRRQRVYRDRSDPLDGYDDVKLFERYRFRERDIRQIVAMLRADLEFAYKRLGALSPELQVVLALGFFATGKYTDDAETESLRPIPNEADFLVSFATVPGCVSWRSKTEGTSYVDVLTQLLDKHADRRDIGEILRQVNHDVEERSTKHKEQHRQAPVLMDTLRKKLVFTSATAPEINPLTATPRRTFSMDNQQLRVPGDKS